ncbi:MAG: dethiobiotin synthase [Legionellaceae bacterium]|nr:dethiobiotin synthase [Legionellaceae bacterium]
MSTYFIIGTDTECGKTYVTCQLLQHLGDAIAIKPIQSGGTEDSDALMKHQPNYKAPICLYHFTPPISPHIAASKAGKTIRFDALDTFCSAHAVRTQKSLLIETTGGLMCPINSTQTWLDYIVYTKKPVIFVVGIRLGCLNHALLTVHALQTHQVPCVGWIANLCDPNMLASPENLATLTQKIPYPHLATIPFNGTMTHLLPLQDDLQASPTKSHHDVLV